MDITKKRIIKNILKTVNKLPPMHLGIFKNGKKGDFYQIMNISKLNFVKSLCMFKNSELSKVIDNINRDRWEHDTVIMSCEHDMIHRLVLNKRILKHEMDIRILNATRKCMDI